MTDHDNCSKSKAKTMLENKIWAQNSNFWNLNIYPQISVFLLSPSHCYQDRKMKTRGWSPTEFVWRLYQHFLLKMAPMTKELQCFHIKWTHCMFSDVCSIFSLLCMPLPLLASLTKRPLAQKAMNGNGLGMMVFWWFILPLHLIDLNELLL